MTRFLYFLLFVFATAIAKGGTNGELLPAEQAFALTVRVADARTIEARWDIAPGYYLYRDKFRFELLSSDVRLGAAQLPSGKKKDDPSFGVVEIYKKSVIARVPIERLLDGAETLRMRISAQGCNEPVGVCYPPMQREVSIGLPAKPYKASFSIAPAPPPQPSPANAGEGATEKGDWNGLRSGWDAGAPAGKRIADIKSVLGLGSSQPAFLPVDKAFRPVVVAEAGNSIRVDFEIAPGYYLYRDKLKFELIAPPGATLGDFELPIGKPKADPHFGSVQVYYDQAAARLPIIGAPAGSTGVIQASFQGCAEKGICYPPTTRALDFIVPAAQAAGHETTSESRDEVEDSGRAALYISAIIGAFSVGLLLSFTPCVLPMIPILSSVIVGQGAPVRRARGGLLSLSYVLGTAVTYTATGVLAGTTGEQLQAYFQNPWAIGIVSVIFVFLALSMFGFFELQMPSFLQSRFSEGSQRVRRGSFWGAFVLGLISALVVGACVSPLLISALGVAISSRDPLLGGLIMFAMALGMGVILIATGIGLGAALPKAGAWMHRVKQVFGVLLLAVAIYLLGLLPAVPVLWLWAALFIITGVYLGATQSLPAGAGGWRYLWKGLGTLLLIWGVAALIGGFVGGRDILKPLPDWRVRSTPVSNTAGDSAHFQRATNIAKVDEMLAYARAQSKPAILDFYATWCIDCVRMEKGVFTDARVAMRLRDFVLVQADVTENNYETRTIKDRFEVFGPPAMLIFAADGTELRDLRFYGYKSADEFLVHLNAVESK